MIDPDVRSAEPADVQQLNLLESEARASVAGKRGGDRWLTTHPERGAAWETSIDQETVLVSHIGDVLVGYLVLTTSDLVAAVEDVYVAPEARELGFGDAMIEMALAAARSAGCKLFEGSALPGDRETKNLYERAGIKARLITVSTPI